MTQDSPEAIAMRKIRRDYVKVFIFLIRIETSKNRLPSTEANVQFKALCNLIRLYLWRFESPQIDPGMAFDQVLVNGSQVVFAASCHNAEPSPKRLNIGAENNRMHHYFLHQLTKFLGKEYPIFRTPGACLHVPEYPRSLDTGCQPCLFGFKERVISDRHV